MRRASENFRNSKTNCVERRSRGHSMESFGGRGRRSASDLVHDARGSATDLMHSVNRARRDSIQRNWQAHHHRHSPPPPTPTVTTTHHLTTRGGLMPSELARQALHPGGEPTTVQLDDEESKIHFEIRSARHVKLQLIASTAVTHRPSPPQHPRLLRPPGPPHPLCSPHVRALRRSSSC